VEHDTRVELAAQGAHRQPVERRKHIVAAIEMRLGIAHAEQPLPRCATTTRPLAIFGARSGNTEAMYS